MDRKRRRLLSPFDKRRTEASTREPKAPSVPPTRHSVNPDSGLSVAAMGYTRTFFMQINAPPVPRMVANNYAAATNEGVGQRDASFSRNGAPRAREGEAERKDLAPPGNDNSPPRFAPCAGLRTSACKSQAPWVVTRVAWQWSDRSEAGQFEARQSLGMRRERRSLPHRRMLHTPRTKHLRATKARAMAGWRGKPKSAS